jgi:hypothetical protein
MQVQQDRSVFKAAAGFTPLWHPNPPLSAYIHPGYVQALAKFGISTELPRSGSWFLKRQIPGCGDFDGMGCYPYLACQDWRQLASDLEALSQDLVSFAAAPDPFGAFNLAHLRHAFPDLVLHFKDHYVADLTSPLERIISKHHQRNVRKALLNLEVECRSDPLPLLDQWMELFSLTIKRFNIKGIPAYSRESFERQFALPGVFMFLAWQGAEIIAAHLWFVHGERAYFHSAAAKAEANKSGASYALYYSVLRYFTGKVRWVDWGGEAGFARAGSLSSFKRGWSNATRPAFFCGRIFNRERYDELTRARGIRPQGYFPSYRQGEFK